MPLPTREEILVLGFALKYSSSGKNGGGEAGSRWNNIGSMVVIVKARWQILYMLYIQYMYVQYMADPTVLSASG